MWLARDEDSVTTGPHTLQRSVCKDSGRAALWPTLLVSECRRDRGGGTREVGTRQAGRQADRQADRQVDRQAGPAGGDGQAGTGRQSPVIWGDFRCCQAVPRKGVGFEVVLVPPADPRAP